MQVFQAEKEKAQPLTSLYLLSRFLRSHDQVSVWANWNLSGLCTEKAESVIRVMYGQDENCATATGCGTIYYGTIYCGTFYYGTFYFGAFQFQPVGMLQQSSSDGLCETLYFEEGVPLLRAALTTYDNGVTGDLRLIEKFLHQEPVLDVIVGNSSMQNRSKLL